MVCLAFEVLGVSALLVADDGRALGGVVRHVAIHEVAFHVRFVVGLHLPCGTLTHYMYRNCLHILKVQSTLGEPLQMLCGPSSVFFHSNPC